MSLLDKFLKMTDKMEGHGSSLEQDGSGKAQYNIKYGIGVYRGHGDAGLHDKLLLKNWVQMEENAPLSLDQMKERLLNGAEVPDKVAKSAATEIYKDNEAFLKAKVGDAAYKAMPEAVKLPLMRMVWTHGQEGASKYVNTLAAARAKNWHATMENLVDSDYYREYSREMKLVKKYWEKLPEKPKANWMPSGVNMDEIVSDQAMTREAPPFTFPDDSAIRANTQPSAQGRIHNQSLPQVPPLQQGQVPSDDRIMAGLDVRDHRTMGQGSMQIDQRMPAQAAPQATPQQPPEGLLEGFWANRAKWEAPHR